MTGVLTQPIIARLGAARNPRVRLLCVPQAGGGTATFRPLTADLPPSVDLCALRLPGRESRRREEPIRVMSALVEEVSAALHMMDDTPLALLGYCSGSFAAYELARCLAAAGRPPTRLVVLASPGPRVVQPDRQVHALARPELLAYLRSARITPESLLADPTMFAIFEPAIRADFQTYETWTPEVREPLPLPVTVVGAREDDSVDLDDLLMWQHHSSDEFTLRMLPGGHDFLGAATARLARTLRQELLPGGDDPAGPANPTTGRTRP